MPFSFAIAPISAIGWTTPISLLAVMMLMRIVLSVIACRSSSRLIEPVLLHRQIGDAIAFFFEPLAGVDHRLVLGDAGDDVIALLAIHLGDALDREVVRLGRAAREDDFLRVGANQVGDLFAGLLDRLFGLPSKRMVAARRIAEVLGEVRQHRLDHARIDRRRRVIVHVDRKLDSHCLISICRHLVSDTDRDLEVRTHLKGACAAPPRASARRRRRIGRKLRDRALAERRQNPLAHAATADRARCTSQTARTRHRRTPSRR